MKPDEDFEDLELNTYVGNSRTMSWVVIAVAVVGFAALAFYAYHSASTPAQGGDGNVVIEADSTPIKESPEDPEGEQFANKDKTIYDVIAPDGSKQAEKLMPEPERPIAAADVEDEDSIAASQEPAATAPAPAAQPAEQPAPVVKHEAPVPAPAATVASPQPAMPQPAKVVRVEAPAAQPADVKPAEPKPEPKTAAAQTTTFVAEEQTSQQTAAPVSPVVSAPEPQAITPAPLPATYASPQMVNERTITGKQPEAKKEEKADAKPVKAEAKVEKPAAKPAPKATAATGGAYKIQLGAYGSEAEAQGAWKKLSGKFAGVLTGAPTIVKAEVNGKTYYRLRTGSFASSDAAKAECGKLAGTPCMAVK